MMSRRMKIFRWWMQRRIGGREWGGWVGKLLEAGGWKGSFPTLSLKARKDGAMDLLHSGQANGSLDQRE